MEARCAGPRCRRHARPSATFAELQHREGTAAAGLCAALRLAGGGAGVGRVAGATRSIGSLMKGGCHEDEKNEYEIGSENFRPASRYVSGGVGCAGPARVGAGQEA